MLPNDIVNMVWGAINNLKARLQVVETRGSNIPPLAATATIAFGVPTATVAGLPAGTLGQVYYATNGRKTGEGVGAGTGVLVYKDATNWRRVDDGTTVAA